MRGKVFVLFIIISISSIFAWRSELYPDSWTTPETNKLFYSDKIIQDFSFAGYHRGEKEIPYITENIIDVTKSPYNADNSGSADATNAIQSAIDAAESAGGGVVYLPAGLYKVSPQNGNSYALLVENSNVVIRGDGAGSTFIQNTETNMRSKHIIKFVGSSSGWKSVPGGSPVEYFLSDVMGPSRAIPVNNASSFCKGEWIIVRSNITEEWISEHNESDWAGYASNFTGLGYCRQVDSINSNSNIIYIDIPVRYAMKTRDNARIYLAQPMLSEVGIEYLSIGNNQNNKDGWGESDYTVSGTGAYETHAAYMISFSRVRNSWIRGVETFQPSGNSSTAHLLSNGILLTDSRSVTIDSCHFQRPQYGGAGGNGYMYRFAAQENLIKDTRATFARHGFVFSQMFASGNVFHNCIDKDGGKQTGLTGSMSTSGKGSDHHMHFSHSNLFDMCTVNNSSFLAAYRPYGSMPKHNLTAAHSVYWNIHGLGSWGQVVHTQQARYGYAIGTWGDVTAVKTSAVGDSEAKTAPVDHVEGVGSGTSLEPQSLYLDQLAKRLNDMTSNIVKNDKKIKVKTGNVILNKKILKFNAPVGKYRIDMFSLNGKNLGTLFNGKIEKAGMQSINLQNNRVSGSMVILKISGEDRENYFKTVIK